MTISQLRQALFEQLSAMEQEFAIAHSRGATLYVNPTNGSGSPVLARGRDGRPVTHMVSNGPYKSAAEEFNI